MQPTQSRDNPNAGAHQEMVPRRDRDTFVAFAFAAADVLITLDSKGRIVEAQGALRTLFGASADLLRGLPFPKQVIPADRPLVEAVLARAARTNRFDRIIVTLAPGHRPPLSVVIGGCLVPSIPGRLFASLSIPAAAPAVGTRDPASGLLDARSFEAAARRAASATDGRPRELSLLRVRGLDRTARALKPEQRQALMAQVGGALRAHAVDGDVAGRVGPDAFGVISVSNSESEAISSEISGIVATLANGAQISTTANAVDLALGELSEPALAQALAYTLHQFAAGAEEVPQNLSAGLAAAMHGTTSRLDALRRMIRQDAFSVAFQPIVDIGSGQIHHFEALARFPDTKSPGETIAFAEEVGAIAEFDLAMTRRVIRQLEVAPRHAIAVNLSARSVALPAFRRALLELIATHAAAAPRLIFELTESAVINDLPGAIAFLSELRRQGHRICLDDFGAGRAGYGYLRRFEVDFVKIDGAFLRAAVRDKRERAILRSVIGLGAELGFSVVGEMIETEEDAALARALGMALGQGYLLGRPAIDLPPVSLPMLPPADAPSPASRDTESRVAG